MILDTSDPPVTVESPRPPPGTQGPTGANQKSPPRDPAGRIGPQDGRTDTWLINNPMVIVVVVPEV